MNGFPILTLLTLMPLIGGLVVVGLGAEQKRLARWLALGFSSWRAGAGAGCCGTGSTPRRASLQFEERHPWIPTLGVEYRVGVDGLGLLMVLLSALVVPMAMLASWKIEERVPLYFALVLFLQAGLFGTFTALNFFHWFIFWELSLIPAFFLIQLWGGPMAHVGGDAVLRLYHGRAAWRCCWLPGDLPGHGQVRLHRTGRHGRGTAALTSALSDGAGLEGS